MRESDDEEKKEGFCEKTEEIKMEILGNCLKFNFMSRLFLTSKKYLDERREDQFHFANQFYRPRRRFVIHRLFGFVSLSEEPKERMHSSYKGKGYSLQRGSKIPKTKRHCSFILFP
ncbi:hypothetical protein TNIN_329531 [Trichonephila inaurata madagascariensis]|uniref:Uncharacterized protein n=1 Tax=Trichonephila inaurata madagascariensis TaxID=2747483 RepID=A0A8X6IWM4_9ARAC|nr:hypothetical protein TNIN_329531 [Trichonephila inaurata madagascariensis]